MTATLTIATATPEDAKEVAAVRNAAAERLTREFGRGHWSGYTTEEGVLRGINTSRVLVARLGGVIVGTLRLATKKPWAIDVGYYAESKRPLYLVDMAVLPGSQREGVGRQLLEAADKTARGWSADAIRLDAYDHAAGAGGFYQKCGFEEVGRATYRGVPLIYFQRLLQGMP
jgi:GNAT superfamily N-acetyltransferase